MKKETSLHERFVQATASDIPDLDIIDLDSEQTPPECNEAAPEEFENNPYPDDEFYIDDVPGDADDFDADSEEPEADNPIDKFLAKLPFRFNIHIVLLAVCILFVVTIAYKINNWGVYVDLDEIFKDGQGTSDNSYDNILPLMSPEGGPVYQSYGEGTNILFFGNAPLSDDRDSENSLVNIIREKTGANVYNCSISGSYLSSERDVLVPEETPSDLFNFYWLSFIAPTDTIDAKYIDAMNALGEDCPPEAMEVYNTLNSIDMSTVDVIAIMYDAGDYLAGREMYNDSNASDILQFCGALTAGIQMWQEYYPHIRFIVMSPTYAYGLDEDGNYVSSNIQRYGQDILSTYVIKQAEACIRQRVSFIDNLYGTITADNADDYLIDHLHLNEAGRELVADRFIEVLQYYNDYEK